MKRRRMERAFTLVEIMIVVAIIALLAAIAIPNVLRSRTSANESAAIGNLRALVSSQEMYRAVNNVYTATGTWVANMYPAAPTPAFGPPQFNIAMTGQTVQGYNYTYNGLPAGCTDALANCTQYAILGVPQTVNQTGTRTFGANQNGTIAHCVGTGTIANVGAWKTVDQAPTNPCT